MDAEPDVDTQEEATFLSRGSNTKLLYCIICFKVLPPSSAWKSPTISDSDRNAKTALAQKYLLALAKMFNISPTIYEENQINFHDVSADIPLYCKSCEATIFSALDLLEQISRLEGKLNQLRTEVKSSLIDSYNNYELSGYSCYSNPCRSNSSFIKSRNKNMKIYSHLKSQSHGSSIAARIRKSYVQCWTRCKVNLQEVKDSQSVEEMEGITKSQSRITDTVSERIKCDEIEFITPISHDDCVVLLHTTSLQMPTKILEADQLLNEKEVGPTEAEIKMEMNELKLEVPDANSFSPDTSCYDTGGNSPMSMVMDVPNESPSKDSCSDSDSDPDFKVEDELKVSEVQDRGRARAKTKTKIKTRTNEKNKSVESIGIKGEHAKGVLRNAPCRQRKLKNRVMPYICDICGKGYRVKYYFEIHQKCHTGEASFPCASCSQSFTKLSKLRQHRLIRHQEEITNSRNIKIREKESEDVQCTYDPAGQMISFQCKHCNQVYHKNQHLSSTGEFTIICAILSCGKTFTKFATFSFHHGKTCPVRLPKEGEVYQCEHCGKRLSTSRCLTSHIISAHTKEFNFYCEICGTGFVYEAFLKQHMVCHTDVKTFKCTFCSRLFKRKKQLTIHMRNHTNEAPYMCTVCGKRFTSNNKMKNHEATHSQVKNFACPICNKLFVSQRYVRNHVWATHEKARKCRNIKPSNDKCNDNDNDYGVSAEELGQSANNNSDHVVINMINLTTGSLIESQPEDNNPHCELLSEPQLPHDVVLQQEIYTFNIIN